MPKRDRSLYMRGYMKEKRDSEKRIKYYLEECNTGQENCEPLSSTNKNISVVSEDVSSEQKYLQSPHQKVKLKTI